MAAPIFRRRAEKSEDRFSFLDGAHRGAEPGSRNGLMFLDYAQTAALVSRDCKQIARELSFFVKKQRKLRQEVGLYAPIFESGALPRIPSSGSDASCCATSAGLDNGCDQGCVRCGIAGRHGRSEQ